ncbi:unnamed protein product [Rotaria sp. Silwood1]|nr:unnamed protein product [Rotaria sp. Silwood1]CAF4932828.1 unnamed protein product [Rotaria sp. Silwood1]
MNFSKKSSCSTHYKPHYVPPYERLLRRNQLWKPHKVKQEQDLQEECRTGKLTPFQQPKNYLCYFIHEQTDILKIDELIDQAKLTNHFSIDTEDDALTHKPATLQVEFIRQTLPSIVIIIEVQYLPSVTNPLFKKIQQLCTIIFTSKNHIYSWGSASQELKKFNSFNLFNTNIKIQESDIQAEYSGGQKAALQKIIKYEFKEYLNKIATLGEWACGFDLVLGTYLPLDVVGPERTYRIKEEKKYRSILKEYAINDVFAVTKLSYKLNLIKFLATNDYEDISEDEDNIDLQQELSIDIPSTYEELIVHVTDELEEINEDKLSYQQREDLEPTQQISIFNQIESFNTILGPHGNFSDNQIYESLNSNTIYVEPDVIEFQPDDDIDTQSIPEIMTLHFHHEPGHRLIQQHRNEQSSPQQMTVHVRNEPNQVRNFHHLDTTTTLTKKQIRNRKTNLRHRANRYRFKVIRRVYHLFRPKQIKPILKSMNIYTLNVNVIRHELCIGLKDQATVDEVERLLHDRMFTKQHYHRLYK